jgi:2,4-dienoyl-CoA reductase-like NADH-dependent reductase (Old Yellow Enzyme family)
LRGTTFRNRAWVSPMCQYSAVEGLPDDWHLVHLGARAVGGAGLVLTEATAVSPEGRISPQDTGIWNHAQADVWTRIAAFVSAQGAAVGMQLAHAGRKGSTKRPWDGRGPVETGGWQTVGASPIGYDDWPPPLELSRSELTQICTDFGNAARRALECGFDTVEVHGAHGYLLHQFLSPLTNQRTDEYGGAFDNRVRFPLEVVRAVRAVWPEETSIRSTPAAASSRESSTDSSTVQPPSAQSVAEMRTSSGLSSGQTARTARTTSRGKRTRLSKAPPYSSVR